MPSVSPNITPTLQVQPKIYRAKGQSNRLYPNIDPEQCEDLYNVNLTERDTAKVRNGYALFNSAQMAGASAVTGLKQAPFLGGTQQVEMAGTAVYKDDGTTRTAITGTLSLTSNSDLRWRSTFISDSVVATNGTDEVIRYTGTGNATDLTGEAGVPFTSCKDILAHKNLLVALRTFEATDRPTRVRWCDINPRTLAIDITNFPDDNRSEIYDGGPGIVGGVDHEEFLWIAKADGLYQTQLNYDSGFIELDILASMRSFEPVARDSILSRLGQPSFVWLIARDGAYIIRPDRTFTVVTRDIQHDWDNSLNVDRLQYAQSWIRQEDRQIRTLMSSSTNSVGHDIELVYDWETGDVWFDTPTDKKNFATSFVSSSASFDFFGTSDGYVYKGNTGTQDNGTDFQWKIMMAPNDLGLPGQAKRVRSIRTYYRKAATAQSNVKLEVRLDQGRKLSRSANLEIQSSLQYDAGNKYDSGLKYPGGSDLEVTFFVNRNAETVQPIWSGDKSFELVGYAPEYEYLE